MKVNAKAIGVGKLWFFLSRQEAFDKDNFKRLLLSAVFSLGLFTLVGGIIDYQARKATEQAWKLYHEAEQLKGSEKLVKLQEVYRIAPNTKPAAYAAIAVANHHHAEAMVHYKKRGPLMEVADFTNLEAERWYSNALTTGKLSSTEQQHVYYFRGLSQLYREESINVRGAIRDLELAYHLPGKHKYSASYRLAHVYKHSNPARSISLLDEIRWQAKNPQLVRTALESLLNIDGPRFLNSYQLGLPPLS